MHLIYINWEEDTQLYRVTIGDGKVIKTRTGFKNHDDAVELAIQCQIQLGYPIMDETEA